MTRAGGYMRYAVGVGETKPARSFYVTAPAVWPLLLGLRVLGVDVERLLDDVGLPRAMLLDPETRISPERALLLLERAIEVTGDANLGLTLARLYEPGAFGTLDYLAQSAGTLREAIELLCRYEQIHQNGMITTLDVEGERAFIRHEMVHPYRVPRQLSENTLANHLVIGRKLCGLEFVPLELWIAHPAPADTTQQEKFFGCPIHWGAKQDVMAISAGLLDAPLLKASPRLATALDSHIREVLQKLGANAPLSARVREQITAELARGVISLERVARKLGLNGRTLQRRLREEETSFAEVLDELRSQLAQRYLRSASLGMEDIALMLGFADTRSFRRSFRRWTGTSPADFRKTAR